MALGSNMTWNYRVVKHICEDDGFISFAIYEVYHNSENELSWTVDHKAPIGDSLDELRSDLNMMLKALDLPVLERNGGTLVEVSDGQT